MSVHIDKRLIVKIAILLSYIFPIVFIFEYFFTKAVIFSLTAGIINTLIMILIKGDDGNKVFSVEKLRKWGPFYYFPLEIAEKLGGEKKAEQNSDHTAGDVEGEDIEP